MLQAVLCMLTECTLCGNEVVRIGDILWIGSMEFSSHSVWLKNSIEHIHMYKICINRLYNVE